MRIYSFAQYPTIAKRMLQQLTKVKYIFHGKTFIFIHFCQWVILGSFVACTFICIPKQILDQKWTQNENDIFYDNV